jgi:hypothetical protein
MRSQLNHTTAREIHALAPSFADMMCRGVKTQRSRELGRIFGVAPKTIRDIWDNRSWKGTSFTDAEAFETFFTDSFLEN